MDDQVLNHQIFRKNECFSSLDDHEIDQVLPYFKPLDVERKEYIFKSQEKNDRLYLLVSGRVRIFKILKNGNEQLIRILQPGDFVGELLIFKDQARYLNYSQAMETTKLLEIDKAKLQQVFIEYPQVALSFLEKMGERLAVAEVKLTFMANDRVMDRVLKYLAYRSKTEGGKNVLLTLPMSRKDIAGYMGTTPETLSRRFKELEDLGLIDQISNREILVYDADRLLDHVEDG